MNVDVLRVVDRAFGIPAVGMLSSFKLRTGRREFRRALVIKLFGLGNIVMLIPAVHVLKTAFPELKIDLLTLAPNGGVAAMYRRYFGRAQLLRSSLPGLAADLGTFLACRRGDYDLVVDAEQFIRLTAMAALWLRPGTVAGLPTASCRKQRAYAISVPYREDRPLVEEYVSLASAIAQSCGRSPALPTALFPPEVDAVSDRRAAECLQSLPAGAFRIGVCVGGRIDALHKRYPSPSWNALLKKLSHVRPDAHFIFTGTKGEAAEVRTAMDGVPRAMDLSGCLTQSDLVGVLSRIDALFSNDTGTIHLAAALGKPCVGFYGPTDPAVYGPYTSKRLILHDPRNANQITNVREKSHEGQPVYWPSPEEACGRIIAWMAASGISSRA